MGDLTESNVKPSHLNRVPSFINMAPDDTRSVQSGSADKTGPRLSVNDDRCFTLFTLVSPRRLKSHESRRGILLGYIHHLHKTSSNDIPPCLDCPRRILCSESSRPGQQPGQRQWERTWGRKRTTTHVRATPILHRNCLKSPSWV